MIRCGWLVDDPGYVGGAELTQAEFRNAAPEDVEVIDCPKGGVVPGLDRYVCHNVTRYAPDDLAPMRGAPIFKYVHDQWPHGPEGRQWLCDHAQLIFCSPLHRDRFPYAYGHEPAVVPPALSLDRFNGNGHERAGACVVAAWRNPGKGGQFLSEWADANEPVDVYGDGPFVPFGPSLEVKGPVEPDRLPETLWQYERFVFLPTELEPFCRSLVEAWAAGLELVTNGLVGARHYIEQEPEKLETAAEGFWELVLA